MNNKEFWNRYKYLIFFVIIFTISGVSIFKYVLTPEKKLPIYSPSMVSSELVEQELLHVKKYHRISDFTLLNQNGIEVSHNNYDNKIYVADFFFTTCPSICPIMTDNMKLVQDEYIDDNNIMLLSLSVTPDIDNIEVLKNYATEKGVNDLKWNITTGSKKHIYELARKSYFAVVDQGDGGLQDFIHTPNFVLVDTKKQIRGIYDGTEDKEISRLIKDINILKN